MIFFMFVTTGCDLPEKYQKKVRLIKPFKPGGQFEAVTHNGSIRAAGIDHQTCELLATITGRGQTVEDAEKVAESINISLVTRGNDLVVKLDRPSQLEQRYYSIDYDVKLPPDTGLEFQTHNGSIVVENIIGHLNISTHNGGIECSGVSGQVHAQTHNGSVKISYAPRALDPVDTMVTTHNGSIEITVPQKMSATLNASTHNGKIKVNRQISVSGIIDKNNLSGKIGTGAGNLYLKTHNGAITIH